MVRMLAPINSEKHYVPRTSFAVTSGVIHNHLIAEGVAPADVGAAVSDVRTGAVVKAVYCEMWLVGTHSTLESQFTVTVEKVPSGGTNMTATQSLNLTSYPNKKNVLYTTQGIVAPSNAESIAVLRSWIKIPKGKQRMGLGDKLLCNINNGGGDLRICGIFIFKEYN